MAILRNIIAKKRIVAHNLLLFFLLLVVLPKKHQKLNKLNEVLIFSCFEITIEGYKINGFSFF